MKKRIKVLMLVTNIGVVNGVSTFTINYDKLIDKEAFEIQYAYYDEDSPNYYEYLHSIESKLFKLPSIKHPISHVRACRQLLEQEEYDIIHVNTLLLAIPMALCARRRVPVRIFHSHNPKLGETLFKTIRNRLLFPVLRDASTHLVACSEIAGAVFNNRPFTIISNLIDFEKFRFNTSKREYIRNKEGVNKKTIVVGVVGRLCQQKNPFYIIDVARELLKANENVLIWWLGDGPMRLEIEKKLASLGLKERIKLLGSRNNIDYYYQGMDAFLMPSLFEGFGLTCLEAQASGLTCFVSDNMSRELGNDGLVHYLSLELQPREWSQEILAYITDNNRALHSDALVVNNRNNIETKKLESFYKKCLEEVKGDK